jgi:arginase
MTDSGPSARDAAAGAGVTLRLLWPQWQGAGTSSVTELASEFPSGIARRGYAVGSAILAAILPPNQGPVATAPVTFRDEGLEERDGIEAKTVIVRQLAAALEVIREHDPARIATLGGECAVSVAPFPNSPAGTAMTWRSYGSTRTPTSARRPASTRAFTPWRWPR